MPKKKAKPIPSEYRGFQLKRGPGPRIEARGCAKDGFPLMIGGGNLKAIKKVIDSQLD